MRGTWGYGDLATRGCKPDFWLTRRMSYRAAAPKSHLYVLNVSALCLVATMTNESGHWFSRAPVISIRLAQERRGTDCTTRRARS